MVNPVSPTRWKVGVLLYIAIEMSPSIDKAITLKSDKAINETDRLRFHQLDAARY